MNYTDVFTEMQQYIRYWVNGNYFFVFIFLIALAFIFVKSKEKRKTIVFPVIILIMLIYNPIMYKYVWYHLINEEKVYWRLFWCIPFVPVIAAAIAELISILNDVRLKIVVLIFTLVLVAICGNSLYTNYDFYGDRGGTPFYKVNNFYKLDDNIVSIANLINDGTSIMIPEDEMFQLRQYKAETKVYTSDLLNSDSTLNMLSICRSAYKNNIDDIILRKNLLQDDTMLKECGYVYNQNKSEILGESYIWYSKKQSNSNTLTVECKKGFNNIGYMILKDSLDRFAIIDGGGNSNINIIHNEILENSGVVQDWIISGMTSKSIYGVYHALWSWEDVNLIHMTGVNYDIDNIERFVSSEDDNESTELEQSCKWYRGASWFRDDADNNIKVLGLDLVNFNTIKVISDNDSIEDLSMVFRLGSKENGVLYVGDITSDRLEEIIQEYGDQLKTKNLVFLTELSNAGDLEKISQPQNIITLYDMQDDEMISIN